MTKPADAVITWKPGLFARTRLTLGTNEVFLETGGFLAPDTERIPLVAIDSKPLRVSYSRSMTLLLATVMLIFLVVSAGTMLHDAQRGDRSALPKSVGFTAVYLVFTVALLVSFWRRSGIFLRYRYRLTRAAAFEIPNALAGAFTDTLSRAVHEAQEARIREAVPDAAGDDAFDSFDDRMAQADHLRRKGLISEEEFQDLKEKNRFEDPG